MRSLRHTVDASPQAVWLSPAGVVHAVVDANEDASIASRSLVPIKVVLTKARPGPFCAPLGCLLVASCSSNLRLDFPDLGEGKTLLLAIETPEARQLLAFDPGIIELPAQDFDQYALTLLTFSASLEELRLLPGPVALVESGRELPPFHSAFASTLAGNRASPWSAIDDLPPQLRGVRILDPGWSACWVRGCTERGNDGYALCKTPCPPFPEPMAPLAPQAPVPPAEVSPPILPQFTPCPTGWSEIAVLDLESLVRCQPPPTIDSRSCAFDEIWTPGEVACRTIGVPCDPSDPFATDLPAGAPTLFVDASAPDGGVGTRAAPYNDLTAAIAASPAGTIVALSSGIYQGPFGLRPGMTLWGRCVAETTLTKPIEEGGAIVGVYSGSGGLRNLRLRGNGRMMFTAGSTTSLQSLRIEVQGNVPVIGTRCDNGTLNIDDVSFTGLGLNQVLAGSNARVRLRRSMTHDATAAAGAGGGRLEVEDVAIQRVTYALVLEQGSGTFHNVDIVGASAAFLARESSSATITKLHVSSSTVGITVHGGSRVRVSNALIESTATGISSAQPGTRVEASRVHVFDGERPIEVIQQGAATFDDLLVTEGDRSNGDIRASDSELTVKRAVLRQSGTVLAAERSQVHIEDLVGMSGADIPTDGAQLQLADGSIGSLARTRLIGPHHYLVGCISATCRLDDVHLIAHHPDSIALAIVAATVDSARLRSERAFVGVRAEGSSSASLADVVIHADRPGASGVAAEVSRVALYRADVALLEGNTAISLQPGTDLVAEDLSLQNLHAHSSTEASWVLIAEGATVAAERLRIVGQNLTADTYFEHAGVVLRDLQAVNTGSTEPAFLLANSSTLALTQVDLEGLDTRLLNSRSTIENLRTQSRVEIFGGESLLRRVSIEGALGKGLFIAGAQVVANELSVVDMRETCDGCAYCIQVDSGTLTLERARIARCIGFGVHLFQGLMAITDTTILGNKNGLSHRADTFRVEEALNRVIFEGNVTDLVVEPVPMGE